MTGGTIPAQVNGIPGICTINVDVQGKSTDGSTPVTHTNTLNATDVIGTIAGTSSTMSALGNATAQITIRNLSIEVVKGFVPQLVNGGAASTLSVELRNPNSSAILTGITFTDIMPTNMIIADVPNFDASDCGPSATLTGVPESSTFTFSGGTVAPANSSCTLTLSITMTVNGNLTNTIPALSVTTFNGVSNQTATSAWLTNLAGASISKGFAPNPIPAGLEDYSLLTITIRNTSNISLSGVGLVDNLPSGLVVAGGSAPLAVNNCGGTLVANQGETSIQLTGASLVGAIPPAIVKCTLIIPVNGATPGEYTNSISKDTLVTNEGATNADPVSATLTLTPYSLGNRVWFDTNNNGIVDVGEDGIPGVRVDLFRDNGATPGDFDTGDAFIGFKITDGTGYYRFDGLGADNYIVTIPADNFRNIGGGDNVASDPLAGYLSSGSSISANGVVTDTFGPDPDNTPIDNDDNGITNFVNNILNYVSAHAVTLGPRTNEPISELDPNPNPGIGEASDNQSDRTIDFGFLSHQLGDLIYQDINENGTFDSGDTPLIGATVKLFAGNGTTEINIGPDGILGTTDDAPGGVVTQANGLYQFSGLPAGNFIVKVEPTGYRSTMDLH